jgi:HD-GYP domain-containing protein (c-di-GMP phosphodiesterase class II)
MTTPAHFSPRRHLRPAPGNWLYRWRSERRLARSAHRLAELQSCPASVARLPRRRPNRLLGRMAAAMDAQDVYTAGHSRRVARLASRLGRAMGLDKEELAGLRRAAAVHDVGKLSIPREILVKPGRLTAQEFALIKRHCQDGASIVSSLGDPELTAIVKHHHERVDGTGYPEGLKGDQIPLGARIVAVVDTYDAVTSLRPYRAPLSHQDALRELQRCAGTQLDPRAVRVFLCCCSGSLQMRLLTAPMDLLYRMLARAGAWPSPSHPVTESPRTHRSAGLGAQAQF